MATPISDDILELPFDIVTNCTGLGFDIGGSVAKVVYRSNKEYKQGKPIDGKASPEKGTVHLAMFSGSDNESVIKYVTDNCDLKRNEEGDTLVYATGLGCGVYRVKMEKDLGIKIKVLAESDLFADAFLKLSKVIPKEDFIHPPTPEVLAEAQHLQKKFMEFLAQAQQAGAIATVIPGAEGGEASEKPTQKEVEVEEKTKEEDKILPCVLTMCGSGTAIMLLKEDGSCQMLETLPTGGRFFLGVMNQFTGIQDYSKLTEMAAAGDGRSVDTFMTDLQRDKSETDFYSLLDYDGTVYPFGKGCTAKREDIKDEDIAFSLLNCVASVNVQAAGMAAALHGVNHIYFSGNFVNSAVARKYFERNHLQRLTFFHPGSKVEVHFLRHGGMYGALGAFLRKA